MAETWANRRLTIERLTIGPEPRMPGYICTNASHEAISWDNGTPLPTLDEAQRHALRTLAGIMFSEVLAGSPRADATIIISDEHGVRHAAVTARVSVAISDRTEED